MSDAVLILCTCSSAEEAKLIAQTLVEERLAACVSLLPSFESIYRWEEKVETSLEILLLIKSRKTLFTSIRRRIEILHSYDTPEVIAISISDGSPKYLEWLLAQLSVSSST